MITVVNKRDHLYVDEYGRDEPFKVYIGRPSPLGNKYSHRPSKYPDIVRVATITEAIQRFEADLKRAMDNVIQGNSVIKWQVEMEQEMRRLRRIYKKYGKLVLECWCAKGEITTDDKPYVCHGQVIAEYLEGLNVWRDE